MNDKLKLKDENLVGFAHEAVDFLGNHWKFDCMGCALHNGGIKPIGGFIYESKYFYVIQDCEIPIEGFLVINAKRHVNSIVEMTMDERHDLVDLIYKCTNAVKEVTGVEKVTLVQEERSMHFHFWVFPNQDFMTEKFGMGISHIRDICAYARENASDAQINKILETIEKLKENFQSKISV